LQRLFGRRSNDCRSAINSLGPLQQPSTADSGLFLNVFSHIDVNDVSALAAITQAMNVYQAFSKGTGFHKPVRRPKISKHVGYNNAYEARIMEIVRPYEELEDNEPIVITDRLMPSCHANPIRQFEIPGG
jgi:hypothetical protein